MKKILIALALVASPVVAQEPAKETTEEINYYARDFPQWAEQDKGSAIERSYNRTIAANDNHAKALAACKACNKPPVIRVEVEVNVTHRVVRKPR
jgi:hypothetical protein